MKAIIFWCGNLSIIPWRPVEQTNLDTGKTRTVREYARERIAFEGLRRYLAHKGAMDITRNIALDFNHCEIVVCVPRVSSDHGADCARVERFVNAVFFGEPTEGLDASPLNDANADQ